LILPSFKSVVGTKNYNDPTDSHGRYFHDVNGVVGSYSLLGLLAL